MIDQAIRLSNLGNDRLILWSLGCFIDSLLPLLKTFLPFFGLRYNFLVIRIDRLFWLNTNKC